MLDTSVAPFFDDFQTNAVGSNYHKILFVPGNAVQARELTQIQSILQEQIKRFGDHIFKNGTVIVPGHIFYDNTVTYLQMTASYGAATTESIGPSLVGLQVVGASGVSAQIVHFESGTATDAPTLFVKYLGASGTVHTFSAGEVLYSADLNVSLQISSSTNGIGTGSIATINDGIYYVNGFFVGVTKQTVVLDKYDATPSYIVGLSFVENVVTAATDPNLYDNALGSPNFAAVGASRYQIQLTLSKKNLDFTDLPGQALISFIPLLSVKQGVIQFMKDNTEYSAIEKMLARRTYDEAGDFIVKDFTIGTHAYRTNNRGAWVASTPYITGDVILNNGIYYMAKNNGYSGTSAPTQSYGESLDGTIHWLQVTTPDFNNGTYQSTSTNLQDHIADEAKLAIQTSAGKAYVQGFEVNVQTPRVTVGKKARDTEQKTNIQIFTPSGSYVQVNTVVGSINTGTMTQVNLLDPGAVVRGTAWATSLEYSSGTIPSTAAVYNLYLFGINLQNGFDFKDDILSIASVTAGQFSATLLQTPAPASGFVTVPVANTNVLGKGTLFTQEFKPGDQIQIGGINKVIQAITDDTHLTVTVAFVSTILTDVPLYGLEVNVVNTGNYIQQLPNVFMRNMRVADGSLDTTYIVRKTLAIPTTTGTTAQITLTTQGETFAGVSPSTYILSDLSAAGAIVAGTYSLDVTATVLTVGGLTLGHNYQLLANVTRSGVAAREKTKTLTTKTIIVNSGNITDDQGNVLSTAWNYTSNVISLTKCDVQRIVKITMSGSSGAYNATGESDVTSWYNLLKNNKQSYYDISTIQRKAGIVVPSMALKVTFEYFEHSPGDYFSVDSYVSIPYNRIPTEIHGGVEFNMRDCLDFRSRISDSGVGFSGTGGSVSTPLYSSSTINTSYSYYLPRTDVLTLSPSGDFEYFTGLSNLNPVEPIISDGSLKLAVFTLDPYTLSGTDSVAITPTPHQRYTMQDINKLEDRLGNVEYYVSLSELEKKTSDMQVLDQNGNNRYKNGFIADPFTSFDVSDVTSPDFRASIDFTTNVLRPKSVVTKMPLEEPAGTTFASRAANSYQVTGDWVTLPYTEQALISQPIATRSENINPFAVFSWNGFVKMTPEKDAWVDNTVLNNTVTIDGGTHYSTIYNNVYALGYWRRYD